MKHKTLKKIFLFSASDQDAGLEGGFFDEGLVIMIRARKIFSWLTDLSKNIMKFVGCVDGVVENFWEILVLIFEEF